MANMIQNAKDSISTLLQRACEKAAEKGQLPAGAVLSGTVEIPKDTQNGDYAANHAMTGARALHMAPRRIAEALAENLDLTGSWFSSVEVAGPGFINFRLAPSWYEDVLKTVVAEGEDYGRVDEGRGQKLMVEFVSANPTGPMHMGNARGGVLGDALASVLDRAGYRVWREFYVNDAGNQIEKFASSIDARYRQQLLGEDAVQFPEDGYQGEDIKELAAAFRAEYGDSYLDNIDADVVFRSPGTPFFKPELVAVRESGRVLTSEMEVFFELCPCKTIAVTGSDGKTTTTTIISEFLKAAGKTVHLGGNIGKPLLPEIESISADDYAVVELSSFQLISMRQSPDVAVVTNLAPNHLDIHKDMQEYIDSKRNIVLHQSAFSKAVVNLDNDIANSFSENVRGQLCKFSVKEQLHNGAYLDGTTICYSDYGKVTRIMDISDIRIPGMHNVENYLAAISAVWGMVDVETIVKVAKEFGGVAHRAEFVREYKGVRYYNDSIASSPTRTALGTLSLYDFKIAIIAGGYDKHIPYEPLGPVINDKVKLLILLGDTAPKIEQAVREAENFDDVAAAVENTQKGDIVSLSPASASFGLYKNFEERGNHFKSIVNGLE